MRGAGSSCRYHLRASASVWASSRSMSTAEGSARNPEGALSLLHIPLLSILPQDVGGFPCPCPAALRAPGATVPVPSPPALGLGCPGSLYGQHLALASSNTHPPALILQHSSSLLPRPQGNTPHQEATNTTPQRSQNTTNVPKAPSPPPAPNRRCPAGGEHAVALSKGAKHVRRAEIIPKRGQHSEECVLWSCRAPWPARDGDVTSAEALPHEFVLEVPARDTHTHTHTSPFAKIPRFQNLALVRAGARSECFEIFLAGEISEGVCWGGEIPRYSRPVETVRL